MTRRKVLRAGLALLGLAAVAGGAAAHGALARSTSAESARLLWVRSIGMGAAIGVTPKAIGPDGPRVFVTGGPYGPFHTVVYDAASGVPV